MASVELFVSAPVAAFRVPQAREYFETLPCPPPSTVYGMLLSLVGEVDRDVHRGAEIAIALLSRPQISVVLRTLWRVKDLTAPQGLGENRRPDYQELLTDVRIAVWVRSGEREGGPPGLAERVDEILNGRQRADRFGGLALGESTHILDEIRPLRNDDLTADARLLRNDPSGDLTLPIWADHVGSRGTNWGQYRLIPADLRAILPLDAWTAIVPP